MEKIQFVKGYRENLALRTSFNELAEKTFGLNFEAWYRAGFWGGDYIPFSAVEGSRVIANVSVNHMRFLKDGQPRFYLQLGTVMTDEEYRGRGLSRRLMEWIFKEYEGRADGIYLFANDTVLDFYPRFGFQVAKEYQYFKRYGKSTKGGAGEAATETVRSPDGKGTGNGSFTMAGFQSNIRKICLESPDNWKAFARKIEDYHTQGTFTLDNLGLLMFYASGPFKDSVYYIEGLDVYAIAEINEDALILYDIYARQETDPNAVAACFYSQGKFKELALGFTPKDERGYQCREYKEADTTVFIKGQKLKALFAEQRMFPLLSHA